MTGLNGLTCEPLIKIYKFQDFWNGMKTFGNIQYNDGKDHQYYFAFEWPEDLDALQDFIKCGLAEIFHLLGKDSHDDNRSYS